MTSVCHGKHNTVVRVMAKTTQSCVSWQKQHSRAEREKDGLGDIEAGEIGKSIVNHTAAAVFCPRRHGHLFPSFFNTKRFKTTTTPRRTHTVMMYRFDVPL